MYSVRVQAQRFQPYDIPSFRVSGAPTLRQNFRLELAPVHQEIVVFSGEPPLSVEPENSGTTITLRANALAGLPDDPTDFAAAIEALAGPSALGPTDAQLFVNGFILNQMPPKETVREIRINDNPFSAENERPATNRIDAVTKSGSKQVHGEGYLNWDAGGWDSVNPYTRPLPPNPSRVFGGNVGGPITPRASFFVSVERTSIDFQDALKATILTPALLPAPLSENVRNPEERLLVSPQVDVTLNKTNSLIVRYSSSRYSLPREGIGKSVLLASAYNTSSRQQTVQVSETAVLSSSSVDETKLQVLRTDLASKAYTSTPTIAVDQAFTTGTSASALNSLLQNQWELQNNLSNVVGHHSLRTGIRLRGETDNEDLKKNQTGTFSFSAGSGPALNADNTPLHDSQGALQMIPLSALERYRRTILFQQQGLPASTVQSLGGGPTSFSVNVGDPRANLRQYDLGVYLQDDWHVRSNLVLGMGLRYEAQTNLQDSLNLGPRFSFAWAPATAPKQNPHTVVRGGIGLFYERLDPSLVLQARQSSHSHWHETTTDPSLLASFPLAPPLASLATHATAADALQIGPNVQAPATLQGTIGLEHELPGKTRVSAAYTEARTFHNLLLVDASPFQQGIPRILTVDSSGTLAQHQVKVALSNNINKRLKLTADYVWSRASSNTDGTTNPAASPLGLQSELGRSAKDIHDNFTLTGSWDVPWGIRLSPFIVASSSRPFNIITGRYQDQDIPYTGRPALAIDPTQPGVIVTQFGAFNLNPSPGEPVIVRNYGRGPAFFSPSFRLSKTFPFGETPADGQTGDKTSSTGDEHRYGIVVSAEVINLANHLNPGIPEGNLGSGQFGQANSIAPGFNFGTTDTAVYHKQLQANRRIELQLRFTF